MQGVPRSKSLRSYYLIVHIYTKTFPEALFPTSVNFDTAVCLHFTETLVEKVSVLIVSFKISSATPKAGIRISITQLHR